MKQRLRNLAAFSATGGVAWLGLSVLQHVGGFAAAAAVVAAIAAAYVIFGPEG